MAKKIIRYGVYFDVDSTSLKQLESQLNKMTNMTLKDFKLIDAKGTKEELEKIQSTARIVGEAVQNSLNPKTGTLNITKYYSNFTFTLYQNNNMEIIILKYDFARKTAETHFIVSSTQNSPPFATTHWTSCFLYL